MLRKCRITIRELKEKVAELEKMQPKSPPPPIIQKRSSRDVKTIKRQKEDIKRIKRSKTVYLIKEVPVNVIVDKTITIEERDMLVAQKAIRAWEELQKKKITNFDEIRLLATPGVFSMKDVGIKTYQYIKFCQPYIEAGYLKRTGKGEYYITYMGKDRLNEIMKHIYEQTI